MQKHRLNQLKDSALGQAVRFIPGPLMALLKRIGPGLAAGVLVGTSYIPLPGWAVLFCYVPLFVYTRGKNISVKDVALQAFVFQMVLTLIGFHWISYTASEFAHLPWPIAILILLVFATFGHAFLMLPPVLIFLLRRFVRTPLMHYFLLATLWSLTEMLAPYLFEWHMGYTLLWNKNPLSQWADVVGFHGLSYLLLLINAFISYTWDQGLANLKKNLKRSIALVILLFLFSAAGSWRGKAWEEAEALNFKVILIQANIGNFEKVYASKGLYYRDFIQNAYLEVSKEALKLEGSPDLMIWPESALYDSFNPALLTKPRQRALVDFIHANRLSLLFGAPSEERQHKTDSLGTRSEVAYYNALFLLSPEKMARGEFPIYRKTHLLAFGEYVPLAQYFPILNEWSPAGPGFHRGKGPEVMDFNEYIKIGSQICYESLDPHFSRSLRQKGANVIVNLTNDSWFGKYFEPEQHLYMTLARAIENRIPLIRATNTGISTVIDASGKIYNSSPKHEVWHQSYQVPVPLSKELTFYARYGHLFPFLLALIFCGVFLSEFVRKSRLE